MQIVQNIACVSFHRDKAINQIAGVVSALCAGVPNRSQSASPDLTLLADMGTWCLHFAAQTGKLIWRYTQIFKRTFRSKPLLQAGVFALARLKSRAALAVRATKGIIRHVTSFGKGAWWGPLLKLLLQEDCQD